MISGCPFLSPGHDSRFLDAWDPRPRAMRGRRRPPRGIFARLGKPPRVLVGERALPALYGAARAFVLPSQAPSEAFGLVQLEAMAAGLPLVVSRASDGVASVHEDGTTALLADRGDVEGLRDAVLRVHDDDDLARRLADAGRRRVRAFYELEHTVDRVEALLRGAARGVSTAP